jgi:hypothetical protein
MLRSNTNFSASSNLVAHVNSGGRIVANNHRRQPRRYVPLPFKRRNFVCHFPLNGIGRNAAIQQFSAMSLLSDHRGHRNIEIITRSFAVPALADAKKVQLSWLSAVPVPRAVATGSACVFDETGILIRSLPLRLSTRQTAPPL